MSEDILDPAAPPPLPAGLGADTPPPSSETNNNRRPPMLPIIPRLPGPAQPASTTTPSGATPAAQPPPPGPAAPAPAAKPTPEQPGQSPSTPAGTAPAAAADGASGEKADTAPGKDAPANDDPAGRDAAGRDDADRDDADPAAADKPPISAADALNIATGALSPALQSAMGLPATLAGLGSGLLAPFAQILSQFGQGTPAMPASSGLPPNLASRLAGGDPSAAVTGEPGQAFQDQRDTLSNQAEAMNNLDQNLRRTLESSAANATLGREKITQIIEQVKAALEALNPIISTPAGQTAVVGVITNGLTAAGAVLTGALGKDTLNSASIQNMARDYIKDIQTPASPASTAGDSRTVLASATSGGPTAWAIKALAVNGITDPRAVRNWLPGLLTMGKRESDNNPLAQNNWDSNARNGIPSKGWMQTIEPTFNAHWRPGTSRNIFDPVANAAAAIHYVMSRYGVSPDGSNLMARVQQANPSAPPRGY
ncbi:MAG: DUF4226 domain-containing protein [Actinomycetota bacterium]|nr:DUF4226 domain-containing protein [Actinomycetota bacterium]MDA2950970.1 DUF4226 domain-containing protein [Actinomycetota bacterium]